MVGENVGTLGAVQQVSHQISAQFELRCIQLNEIVLTCVHMMINTGEAEVE